MELFLGEHQIIELEIRRARVVLDVIGGKGGAEIGGRIGVTPGHRQADMRSDSRYLRAL